MKTKTSLWFSFCTLVLCLGVMTFGVYSALSASLNMSGTLGFNMHNCVVSVEGTIYNLAEITDENTAQKIDKPIQRAIMGGENTTSANLDIGTLNFYRGAYTDGEIITAKTYDIIFEIKFTNMHTKAISAIFPIPTVSNSNISIISGEDNNYTAFESENSTYHTRISQNSSTTVKFALHLDDSSAVLSNVTLNWRNISFIEAPDLLYNYDKENDYYYLEMGVNPFNNNEPLRWISFAKYDESIQGFDFFDKSEEPVSGGTYYFISELVMYTEYDEEYDIAYGVPYQNYYSWIDYKVLGLDKNYLAQDYAVSTIRKYLNGGTVNNQGMDALEGNLNGISPYGKEVSIEPYQIFTSKIYQDYIIPRDLSDLYEVSTHMQQEGIDLYDCGKEKDKLWILSNTKKTNNSNTEFGWLDDNYLDYLCGNVTGKSFYYDGEAYYSRTPSNIGGGYGVADYIANCYTNSHWGANDIMISSGAGVQLSHGIRPCFQITMP